MGSANPVGVEFGVNTKDEIIHIQPLMLMRIMNCFMILLI